MKINQKYLADLLKVSRVTVTKALNDDPDISQGTRDKVKALANELGYIPNGIGRSLATKKTKTIGIVVPKIDHSFFSQAIESMYATAEKMGYQVLMVVSFESKEKEQQGIKTLLSMNVDGLIVDTAATVDSYETYELVEKYDKPLLFFDRSATGYSGKGIFFDDYQLSYQITAEIIKLGYRKIAYMTGPDGLSISKNRLRGYINCMQENGISYDPNLVISTGLTESEGFSSFERFLRINSSRPQTVLCVNDSVALGVYQACDKLDIKIPDDLGVAGFGNLLISKMVLPSLSTVDLPVKEAAEQTILHLVRLINQESPPQDSAILAGNVIIRESVRKINLD